MSTLVDVKENLVDVKKNLDASRHEDTSIKLETTFKRNNVDVISFSFEQQKASSRTNRDRFKKSKK